MADSPPKNFTALPATDPLMTQVAQTIDHYAMLKPGDKVLVGVSAGPDSMALAHVLHTLAPGLKIQIGMAHLDHGLRPEAAGHELALVLALAQRLDVSCHTGKIDDPPTKGSLEEQLRLLRYTFFEQTAQAHGYTKIALGHQADDNAEAVLMRLLRGSGTQGLAGIPPVRDQRIIRPLIDVQRRQIMAYLGRHHLNCAQDPSNADLRFTRNKIRHRLIPLLQTDFNPNLVQTLNRMALLCREEEQWWTAHLDPLQTSVIHLNADGTLELHIAALVAQPRPVQRRLVRGALGQWMGHLRGMGAEHIEAILDLAAGKKGRRLNLPGGIDVQRASKVLCFTRISTADRRAGHDAKLPYQYTIALPQQLPLVLEIPEAKCRLRFSWSNAPVPGQWHDHDPSEIFLDMDQLVLPLIVRNLRPGDRFQPFGVQGTQKLKHLFINRKIPRHLRQRIPLLLSGPDIVWVTGVRRGAAALLSPATTRVLRVESEMISNSR